MVNELTVATFSPYLGERDPTLPQVGPGRRAKSPNFDAGSEMVPVREHDPGRQIVIKAPKRNSRQRFVN